MTDDNSTLPQPAEAARRWQPLGAIDRRVIGVLAEKAKTTPAGYPMSLNAIRTGSNQKSNRAPLMDLEADDVGDAAVFLTSPLAQAITGTVLYVDNGYHAMGMAVALGKQEPTS